MPSPFPGMNPYLENPELWPEFQSWLVIAIADAIAPQLRPKYRVAVEKRVYQMIDENSILVGIPDVVVGRSLTKTEKDPSNIAVAASPTKPITVNVPILEEVGEGYLEVRKIIRNDARSDARSSLTLRYRYRYANVIRNS